MARPSEELEGVLGDLKYVVLPHFRSRTLRTVPNDVKPPKTQNAYFSLIFGKFPWEIRFQVSEIPL